MNNSSYAQFAAEKVIAAADNEINRIKDISHESIVSTYNIFVPIWNADVEKANKPNLFDKIIGKLSKLAGKKHKHFEPAKIQNDSKKFREIETHIINECRRFTGEIKFPNLDFPPPRRDPMDEIMHFTRESGRRIERCLHIRAMAKNCETGEVFLPMDDASIIFRAFPNEN